MTYSPAFRRAVALTLEAEGLFSDHARDPGGKTMYGVTEAVARRHGIRDVRRLTVDQAKAIYHADYWQPIRADDLAEPVALEMFDTGVNVGPKVAVTLAQRAYNVLRRPTDPALAEDGKIGPQTIAALNRMAARYAGQLVAAMNGEQYRYYRRLVEQDPDRFRAFARGWARRLEALHEKRTA